MNRGLEISQFQGVILFALEKWLKQKGVAENPPPL
jgi:hypothetical protein